MIYRAVLVYTANSGMTKAILLLTTAVGLTAALAGCSENSGPKTTEYQMAGQVLKLDPAAQTASVRAGKIDGWMDAMTMEFPIKDKQEFQKLSVGETIRAKVLVQGTEYWLSGISQAPAGSGPAPR
jgi:Cu/Ag efflux protein CusF